MEISKLDLGKSTQDLYHEGTRKVYQIKGQVLRLMPFWIAGSVTALVATGYAKLFAWAELLSLRFVDLLGPWFLFIPPAFLTLSWILVEKIAPGASGSGIPQLMASVDLAHKKQMRFIDRFLASRVAVVKVISSLLGVAGGGSIGREGPTLQISGSIFYTLSKLWHFSEIPDRSAFLLAGAASGLASAFNTPLGGIVYAVEELAKSHLNTFRTGLLHAVIFSGIISQMIMGSYLYLGYPKLPDFQFSLLPHCIVIAAAAAIVVSIFVALLKSIVRFRGKLSSFRSKFAMSVSAGFMFSALVLFFSKSGLGPGRQLLIGLLFHGESARATDVLARLFGTLMTYAGGGAGGIFAPTLSLAGSVGSFVSSTLNFDLGSLPVLIGMTSGLAALTHSPLTSFILVLEMTDRHSAIFPLMLAAVAGHALSKLISPESFYDMVCGRVLSECSKD